MKQIIKQLEFVVYVKLESKEIIFIKMVVYVKMWSVHFVGLS